MISNKYNILKQNINNIEPQFISAAPLLGAKVRCLRDGEIISVPGTIKGISPNRVEIRWDYIDSGYTDAYDDIIYNMDEYNAWILVVNENFKGKV